MYDDADTLAGQPAGRCVVMGVPRLDAARTRRLAELGLRAGTKVLLRNHTAGGGRIVAVGDTRIALDRATLLRLPVVPAPDDGHRR
ncbi:FeoA family protein [Intrasporangium sp.]|uniref:FeoA family protein n=1 Tax=Intrasporangium sp. TaxID=1925024 RepID=UPI00293A7250|nr:FeoA family protein [Intrasporangium sp.]MDV3221435.1 ferrous iron transport protein A [Intrasporangium sp.]